MRLANGNFYEPPTILIRVCENALTAHQLKDTLASNILEIDKIGRVLPKQVAIPNVTAYHL